MNQTPPRFDTSDSNDERYGICAVIPEINVDTDAIFPKQNLTTIHASLPQSDLRQLQSGLDEIGVTLEKMRHNLEFEMSHHRRFPWLLFIPQPGTGQAAFCVTST